MIAATVIQENTVARHAMRTILLLLLLAAMPAKAEIYDIKQLDLASYKGKVVYLDFWASWCKPCQKSFPWMNSLLQKYPAESFTVITVNLDAETESMHHFLGKVKADFDIFHDPSGRIAEEFKIEGMPTSYLIDRSGKVVKKHIGFYTKKIDKYEDEIEELL
jgi:thiol-disulfide isomerase/thioredoxin